MNTHASEIFTIAQMKAWEDAHNAAGLSYAEMMERAGSRAAADLAERFAAPQKLAVLCGHGNNGGDGLVLARVLAQCGWQVSVVLLQGSRLSPLAQANLAALPPQVAQIDAAQLGALLTGHGVDMVADAVYGTGFRGALPENAAAVFDAVAAAPEVFVVALDLPSGIHGDSADIAPHTLRARLTYTFQAFKPAHMLPAAQAYCGEIIRIALT